MTQFVQTPTERSFCTVEQHILSKQGEHDHATGAFSSVLVGITLAGRIISAKVRRAGILEVLGEAGDVNVHGEQQQKLDLLANKALEACLCYRESVGIIASEELDEPRIVRETSGKYVVIFDPLDGSSNIDVNVSVGTIFSIFERDPEQAKGRDPMSDVLQPGKKQVAAGYIVYGSSTVLCYTTGDGVHMFTLDPSVGSFVLAQENVRMPLKGKYFSVNEGNFNSFPTGVQAYLNWCKSEEAGPYNARYIGSMVADFHRTLLRGGIFLYPPTARSPKGKLRLMYEANPIAFIAEQAGGRATDGTQNILEKVPGSLHERTPLLVGSETEIERIERFMRES